jgi:quinol monooxygenase YgiN
MATLLVKLRVASFDTWKKVFDSMDHVRREHGITASTVHRDAADPNIIVIINHAQTIEGAKSHGRSQALRDAMARAGVQGIPEINFLEDVA